MNDNQEKKGRNEELKDIVNDFKGEKKEQAAAKNKAIHKREVGRKIRIISKTLLFLLVGTLIGYNMLYFVVTKKEHSSYQYWALGKRVTADYKLNECVFKLWQIRKSVDLYYVANGAYPKTIEELSREKFFNINLSCPVSKKQYITKKIGGREVIACPNPQEQNIEEVYVQINSGPPIIVR